MHVLPLTALLLCAAADARAEPTAPPRTPETADAVLHRGPTAWDRKLHDALGLPVWLDLAFEQRTRFERLEEPFRPGEPDTQTLYVLRTRLRIGVDGPGPLRWLAELQDARVQNVASRDFTTGAVDHLDVLQLFVSATARDLGGSGLRADAHVGRLTLDHGSRRVLVRSVFRNTTNAFDGVHLRIASGTGRWRVRAFATRPVAIEPGSFDDESSSQQRFWGVAFEDERIPGLGLDGYYLGLRDRRSGRDYHTIGARGLRPPGPGRLDGELELIGQLGERHGLDQRAFAGHAELGYTLACSWRPRLAALVDYASGTADPDGEESHGFDPLFGGRRGDLMPTGLFGPFRRSNLFSPGIRLAVAPRPDLTVRVKARYWELAHARDAFAGTGLRDATGRAGRRLGTDVELGVQWSPAPWLTLDAGYDHWFKGSYLDRVAGVPSRGDADYFYLSTEVRF